MPQPAAVAVPILLTREQSAVRPTGLQTGTLTVTFTVHNNLPPVVKPAIPATATLTETTGILAAYDAGLDPNTARNVLVVATLSGAAAFANARPAASRNGNTLAWSLGDIPPMGAVTATVVLTVTPVGGDFNTLVSAAAARATLHGRVVMADTGAVRLASEALGAYLGRTPDADTRDAYLLRKVAELGGDPARLLGYVQSLGYQAYTGSLRGTRGTLWSGAGNALDKSSLLIALLRASGVPARYRHGTLSPAAAASLIAGMFPLPERLEGYVPPGAAVSDPAGDAGLLATASDHWWVEAYIGGAWTDLDPSFAGAAIGASFHASAASDGTDRTAEAPDALRHKINIRLRVERYAGLTGQLTAFHPLSATFNAVEVAGRPVALSHFVNASSAGGLVFSSVTRDYMPFLIVGDDLASAQVLEGDNFQDLASSFANVASLHLAEWLEFELRHPSGQSSRYEREIVDRLGYDARASGGAQAFTATASMEPLANPLDVYVTHFWPGFIPGEAIERAQAAFLAGAPQTRLDLDAVNTLGALGALDAAQTLQLQAALFRLRLAQMTLLSGVGLMYGRQSSLMLDHLSRALLVRAYPDAPHIVTIGAQAAMSTTAYTIDLRRTILRVLAYPGQAAAAPYVFNLVKGMSESSLEADVLEGATGQPATGSAEVLSLAQQLGIPFVALEASNLGDLSDTSLSSQARARIASATLAGRIVVAPSQPVSISGALREGWFEIDPATGETIGAGGAGLHTASIEYSTLGTNQGPKNILTAFAVGLLIGLMNGLMSGIVGKLYGGAAGAAAGFANGVKFNLSVNAALCEAPFKIYDPFANACAAAFQFGMQIGAAITSLAVRSGGFDPPLPEMLYGGFEAPGAQSRATRRVSVAASLPAGALSAAYDASLSMALGPTGASVYAGAVSGLGLGGSWPGAAAFAPSAVFALTDGGAGADGASGSLTINGQPVALPGRFAIGAFTGAMTVTSAGARDSVALRGTGDLFSLRASPQASAIRPVDAASFTAALDATFSGPFTLTVEAPEGWDVGVSATGGITAAPPAGAGSGAYAVIVTAQPAAHPRLSVSAIHTVTVTAHEGMRMSLAPDPLITVPWGPSLSGNRLADENDGRLQLPGAAFRVEITNTSNLPRVFDAAVAGLPADWVIFAGRIATTTASLALPPGGAGRLGLYVSPTLALPPAGSSIPFTVTAVARENGALAGSASQRFVVPALPYAYLTVSPLPAYSNPGGTTTLDLSLRNVGNAPGAFSVAFAPQLAGWSAAFTKTMNVAAGAAVAQRIVLSTPTGVLGADYTAAFSTRSGGYTQTATALVILASPFAACGSQCASRLAAAGQPALAASAQGLTDAMAWMELDPADPARRDAALAALTDLLAQLGAWQDAPAFAMLNAAAVALFGQAGASQINQELCAALSALADEAERRQRHGVAAWFAPGAMAVSPGRTVSASLRLAGIGAQSTAYSLALSMPGAAVTPALQVVNLAPGASATVTVLATPPAAGLYSLSARVEAMAGGAPLGIRASALASVNAVEAFARVLDVSADPPFAESGAGAVALRAAIANEAGLAQNAMAAVTVTAPAGGVSHTAGLPLVIRAGNPQRYPLGVVDVAGWRDGVYTVAVTLHGPGGAPFPAAGSQGYLVVGEGLSLAQAASPELAPPGDAIITATITTTVRSPLGDPGAANMGALDGGSRRLRVTGLVPSGPSAPAAAPQGDGAAGDPSGAADAGATAVAAGEAAGEAAGQAVFEPAVNGASFSDGLMRAEQTDSAVAAAGAWSALASDLASGGTVSRSQTPGDALSFAFAGAWVSLGYLARGDGRNIEVFIDGASRGVIDTYARAPVAMSRVYAGLSNGPHTLSVTVRADKNAFAAATAYAHIDYFDAWDGTALPPGVFDQADPRIIRSGGWFTVNLPAAQGGSHARTAEGAAWFAFTGDSALYQGVADDFVGGDVSIWIDGAHRGYFDMRNTGAVTRAFSFTGLGSGPHVMTVQTYRGYLSVDAFGAPGSPPFHAPAARAGIARHEEDDAAVRFNGAPFTATRTTWSDLASGFASQAAAAASSTAGDVASLAFTGTWVSFGYVAAANGGLAEVFIDGDSRGVLDTYGKDLQARSAVYGGLTPGAHVISVTVLGQRSAFATSERVRVDYFDVWDGTALPDGVFEHAAAGRVLRSSDWISAAQPLASAGGHAIAGSAAWFFFTGDSVTYRAMAGFVGAGEAGVWVDGAWKGYLNLRADAPVSRSLSFSGLGPGPHVLTVNHHRGPYSSVDAFKTPGEAPFADPSRSGVYRLEEDDPALRYNGAPFTATSSAWDYTALPAVSDAYAARSAAPGDVFSLTFSGPWVGLGFATSPSGRQAELFLDGASQGVIDTYSPDDGVASRIYSGLLSATHTVSVVVLGSANISATGFYKYVNLDYVDVWDGTPEPPGLFDEDSPRVHLSSDWSATAAPNANGGAYAQDGANAWFLFTGDRAAWVAMTDAISPTLAEVFVDGVSRGLFDLHYPYARSPKPFAVSGLGPGAHVMRVADRSTAFLAGAGVDAFDTSADLFAGVPMVEWAFQIGSARDAFAATPAVGDLDGDGVPEVVGTTTEETCFGVCINNRALYVVRGDGSGLVFSRTITGTGGVESPSIANLDGGSDAEIVVGSGSGLRAYKHDGALMWHAPSVKGTWLASTAIGNLDADAAPEIVAVNDSDAPLRKAIHVVESDGRVTWVYTLPTTSPGPRAPVLADLTGDGRLDIVAASGRTLYAFDYAGGVSPTLLFTRAAPADHYGAPAVADIDGDGRPEIVIGWDGIVSAYEHDGAPKWTITTTGRYPSSIAVAELDGNDGGAPEIALYSKTSAVGENGRVFALNADGTLLWSRPAADTTNSSAGLTVLDLDGDGVWELAWNGYVSGTLILRGSDGALLFQEPNVNSGTVNETPVIADVDNDGRAEVLLVDADGLYVLGFDAGWAPSRPVWNQHSYHITNINDDLSVPAAESDSWRSHNTYRTQSPYRAPLPAYGVRLTYTAALTGVAVQAGGIAPPPDAGIPPAYAWSFTQTWHEGPRERRIPSLATALRPGEIQPLSQRAEAAYTAGGQSRRLALPPLLAAAARIVFIEPAAQAVNLGSRAAFTVVLHNPAAAGEVYSLTTGGLPAAWSSLPVTVALAAGARLTLPLTVTVPRNAVTAVYTPVAGAATRARGADSASAQLSVLGALGVDIAPGTAAVAPGGAVTYSVVVRNREQAARVIALLPESNDPRGLALSLPPTVAVAAGAAVTLPLRVDALGGDGLRRLSVQAVSAASGLASAADAAVEVIGTRGVLATLSPATRAAGRGTPAAFTLRITNTGSLTSALTITAGVPAGWAARLEANGAPVARLVLAPRAFNAADLTLVVTPSVTAAPGGYPISATVQSAGAPPARATASAVVQVSNLGAQISLTPKAITATPGMIVTWTARVTNTGQVAQTFLLEADGPAALQSAFTPTAVTLSPGAGASVPLVANGLPALVGRVSIGASAIAQTNSAVRARDAAEAALLPHRAAQAGFVPGLVRAGANVTATYLLFITNTGTLDGYFTVAVTGTASRLEASPARVYVPARMTAAVLVRASASRSGRHAIEARVQAEEDAFVRARSEAALEVGGRTFLPFIWRGP